MVNDHHCLMSVLEIPLSEIKFQARMLDMRVSENPLRGILGLLRSWKS
jgi:hypothetical protein